MTAASKLQGIKPGDRVRVTFEAKVLPRMSDGEVLRVQPDGEGENASLWLVRECFEAPTFQIERIEPPLAVGDRVQVKGGLSGPLEVLAIKNDYVWLGYGGIPLSGSARLSDLERIP